MTTYPSLEQRVVFISGGGSGIGASLVEHFAQQGARVAFCDIDIAASQALVARLAPTCKHAPQFGLCDIRDIAGYQAHLRQVEATMGAIRVLVNNAGNDTRHTLVPGAIVTERQEALWRNPDEDHKFIALQCLKFRLDASHVARTALFLAADDSSGITGQNIVVDAGLAQVSVAG